MNIESRIIEFIHLHPHGLGLLKIVRGILGTNFDKNSVEEYRKICDGMIKKGLLDYSTITDFYKPFNVVSITKPNIKKKGVVLIIKMREEHPIDEIHISGDASAIDHALCIIAEHINTDEVIGIDL